MSPNNCGGQKLIHEDVHEVGITLLWLTSHPPVPSRTARKIIIACDSCFEQTDSKDWLSNQENYKLTSNSYSKLQWQIHTQVNNWQFTLHLLNFVIYEN